MADLYGILGVSKQATKDELKSAYRKLAKQYHPDMFSTASEEEKKKAEAKFKEINHAYEVLSDDQKRAAYDTYGNENGPVGGGGGFNWSSSAEGFDMDDIFSTIFNSFTGGGRRRGSSANRAVRGDDIMATVTITFEEAAFGCEKEIKFKRTENCKYCGGTGAKGGTAFKTCPKCNGTGTVNVTQSTVFGRVSTTTTCPDCKGKGKIITEKCPNCNGKGRNVETRAINAKIPAGIADGQQMSYYNEGEAGINGGPNGTLVVLIRVKPHALFRRQDYDLYLEMPVTMTQAALGCTVQVPTLTKPVEYTIPEGTQSGTVFRIKGKGIKQLKREQYGDLYVTVIVETPKSLTKEQRDLLFRLESTFENKQYPKRKAYKEKL